MNIQALDSSSSGASLADLDTFERLIGRTLPSDYKEFLRRFNFSHPIRPVEIPVPADNSTDVLVLYGVGNTTQYGEYRSEFYLDQRPDLWPDSIAIGHDSGGNLFWLLLSGTDYGAVCYEHRDWAPSTGKVAASWSEFEKMLSICLQDI